MTSGAERAGRGAGRDYDQLVQRSRVHRSVYVDGDIFAEEMRKIFGAVWTYLGHESEIPEANDFKATRLGLRPVLLTRAQDGSIHALLNRCMHRGTVVCTAASGNARSFTCSYHGWTYSNTGKLTGVPFPGGTGPDFDRSELSLLALPQVESYRGFIFGVLDAKAPSLREYLGPAAALLDEWIGGGRSRRLVLRHGARRIAANANWKLYLDGAADGLHPLFTHRSFIELCSSRYRPGLFLSEFRRDPDDSEMYSQIMPNGHQYLDQRPSMTPTRWSAARPMPGMEHGVERIRATHGERADAVLEQAAFAGMNIFIFPNLSLVDNNIGVIQPVAANRTEIHWYPVTLSDQLDETLALRMRNGEDSDNFVNVDDVENWERAQEGLENVPEAEWLHTGRGIGTSEPYDESQGVATVAITNEEPMRAYQQVWKRLMQAPAPSLSGVAEGSVPA
ncbi:MAG TPA: Rieske 2Fe-2S domain-containing protein [Candidatus Dormibacteraeota bacterium]|nr:Rieske 2Fe-2S domain-containing protein [Candidatus Dormibacteraeota bacterium]